MSATDLEIAFEGEEVDSGKIDAGVLGNALAGYSEVFRRANELANGEASTAVVLVEADFKRASFDVNLQLVQALIDNAKALITAHPSLVLPSWPLHSAFWAGKTENPLSAF
ncbi:MAG: hypothetical protein ACR2IF_04495 [Terriglobales bacterium]